VEIIDGVKIFEKVKKNVAKEVAYLLDNNLNLPHISAIVVGEDDSIDNVISKKEKMMHESGFVFSIYHCPENIKEEQLLELIEFINADDEIDGIVLNLPLPVRFSSEKIIQSIAPSKDVDGIHPDNLNKYYNQQDTYLSMLPCLVGQILNHYSISAKNKNILVATGSKGFYKMNENTLKSLKEFQTANCFNICDIKNDNFNDLCKDADILILDSGKPGEFKLDKIKENAVVIDLGMHKIISVENESGYKIIGDVDFKSVSKHSGLISKYNESIEPLLYLNLLTNSLKAIKKEI